MGDVCDADPPRCGLAAAACGGWVTYVTLIRRASVGGPALRAPRPAGRRDDVGDVADELGELEVLGGVDGGDAGGEEGLGVVGRDDAADHDWHIRSLSAQPV